MKQGDIYTTAIVVNYNRRISKASIELLQIVEDIRSDNVRGPILLRFPHLIKRQIKTLYSYFVQ